MTYVRQFFLISALVLVVSCNGRLEENSADLLVPGDRSLLFAALALAHSDSATKTVVMRPEDVREFDASRLPIKLRQLSVEQAAVPLLRLGSDEVLVDSFALNQAYAIITLLIGPMNRTRSLASITPENPASRDDPPLCGITETVTLQKGADALWRPIEIVTVQC